MRLIRVARFVMAGLAALAGFSSAMAFGGKSSSCCAPACDPCATSCKVEMVAEPYTYTRTTYKMEQRTENYTAYKTEMVPETKTRTFTVTKYVPETVMETKTICEKVPVTKQVTEMCTRKKLCWVEEVRTKCVDRGHYETVCVPACGGFFSGLFSKGSCCDPCAPPPMKSKKVWVSCPTTETYCVKRPKFVEECYPVTKCVTCYETVSKTICVPVTRCKPVCEQKTETYTVCKKVCTPYQATRTVCVCVPHTETVTACRMVPKMVHTPASNCCEAAPACCN